MKNQVNFDKHLEEFPYRISSLCMVFSPTCLGWWVGMPGMSDLLFCSYTFAAVVIGLCL